MKPQRPIKHHKAELTITTKHTWGMPLTEDEAEEYRLRAQIINRRSRDKRRLTVEGRARTLRSDAKRRAEHDAVPITITEEWIQEKLKAGICEVTGIPFVFEKSDTHRVHKFAPSLDRKNPRQGYTEKNTRVVVWMLNHAKGEYSDTDLLDLAFVLVKAQLQEGMEN